MALSFKMWLESEARTVTRFPNYPPAYAAWALYPELMWTPISADVLSYYNAKVGKFNYTIPLPEPDSTWTSGLPIHAKVNKFNYTLP